MADRLKRDGLQEVGGFLNFDDKLTGHRAAAVDHDFGLQSARPALLPRFATHRDMVHCRLKVLAVQRLRRPW